MRNYDLTPLYRSAIGFDRLARLAEHAAANNGNAGYPPYNIELLGENRYRITMAVAALPWMSWRSPARAKSCW